MENQKFDLDAPLLRFSGGDVLTVKDSFEGIAVFGGIGAGKTTSSGRLIALNMLRHGYAGLVLTAKPDEVDLWRQYVCETGRGKDLIIIEPGGSEYFNFLDYECRQTQKGVSLRHNIVSLLETVINSGQDTGAGLEDGRFWASALRMTLSSVTTLCLLGYGTVNVQDLFDIAMCAPKEDDGHVQPEKPPHDPYTKARQEAERRVQAKVNAFLATFPKEEIADLEKRGLMDAFALQHVSSYRALKQVNQFFSRSYKKLSSKTKSAIEFMIVGFLYQLLSEPFYSLFCNNPSTFTPETCLEKGSIVVLNLPTKLHHEAGRMIQVATKYCFQRAWEKRDTKVNNRPAFIFADESPIFLHALDADFQATARSSMIATVYLAQNLPGYFANMGGDKSTYKVKQFLGTLATKIFHANADADTNKYASELIGQEYYDDKTEGVNFGDNVSFNESKAQKLRQIVRPEEFFRLATGGKNGFICEAYIHRQGAPFNGKSHKKVRFKQQFFN
ncbi:AAA-like domain-containing protein [Chitinophaga eiseniae]|uniref:AAA-like domain-containing protein n=1 Tax=Chitinophaga eiseniae TaxID=634771 RepID=A0A1T4KPN9_9BACT|nr:TraM recognition domain-containing protein [Chitinophaga eiseniae]SJZ44317.1 AAA-like domain-containing protein [Chitinophaga eiseniae]